MPSSEAEICNLALGHLGEAPIVSLDDDDTAARACSLRYAATRDAALRAHRWNFAKARATLSELDDAPSFGWLHQFQLPADCLRVVEFNDSEVGDTISDLFEVEGQKLLTDSDEANLVYIQRVTNVALFDSLFVEVLALKLAIALSEVIRGTTGKTQELTTAYERLTAPLARRVDANEGRRRKGTIALSSQFVRARGGEF